MSDYTKSTNFAAKDALASGNAAKIVKGTEIDTEFNNIATAVATKADLANPTFTGTVTIPSNSVATTQAFGNNSTFLATTAFVQAALSAMYPVGSIYTNATVSTNPATLLGFGTWAAFAAGRVMVGLDGTNAAFDTLGETGGSADSVTVAHTHTATSTVTDPGHVHTLQDSTARKITAPAGGAIGGGTNTPAAAPSGNDFITAISATTGVTVATTVASTGSSGTNANLPPYITVYMWKRTA
jgi:hypothetical protein